MARLSIYDALSGGHSPDNAFICDVSNLLTNKQDHNHTPTVYNSETIKVRNKLKRAAQNSTLNLRELFDDQTRDEQAGASTAHCQIRNSLIKRRKNSTQVRVTAYGRIVRYGESPYRII